MKDKLKYYMDELKNGWIHNSMRGSWRWCPRQFKLRFIDGERSPETSVLLMGNLFHDFASFYHKEIKIEEFNCFSLLSDLIEWQLLLIPENTLPILKIYLERFIRFECRRFWFYARGLDNPSQEFLPRYTEFNLRHKRPGDTYGVAGTIDSIFKVVDGRNALVRLREYKVSRKTTRDSQFMSDVRGQLTFYKNLIDRVELYGEDMSFRFELYNPIQDTGVFPLETGSFTRSKTGGVYTPYWFLEIPKTASQTALNTSLDRFFEALEAEYFPRQPKKAIVYKCNYCSFYGICWGRY